MNEETLSTRSFEPMTPRTEEFWQKIVARKKGPSHDISGSDTDFSSAPTKIADILNETELSNNEISLITGISPAYLSALKRGIIQKGGREKLLVLLMVALDKSLEETNYILTANDYAAVDKFDAKLLISASLDKKISGFQTLRTNLNLLVLQLSLEKMEGDTLVVHNMPDPALISKEYAIVLDDSASKNDLYVNLISDLHEKRTELFYNSLERGDKRYYLICQQCFKEYLESSKSSDNKLNSIISNLRNTINVLEKYKDNFKINVIRDCQRHWFKLKLSPYPVESVNDFDKSSNMLQCKDKVVFAGRASSHLNANSGISHSVFIRAFATDSKRVCREFYTEFNELVKYSIVPIVDMPSFLADQAKRMNVNL